MPPTAGKQWHVKYDGPCERCGVLMPKGSPGVWDPRSHTMRHIECPNEAGATPGAVAGADESPIDYGVAGASTQREYERLKAKRETVTKKRWGDRLGGLILALSDERQTTTAWARGSAGEVKVAKAMGDTAGIHVLNDRGVPRDRRNIDHIVVASGGVFVVDAKKYKGQVRIVNKGWFFRPDERLYVGGWDRSERADDMAWQVEAVTWALSAAGIDPLPPITPVLCFVDADWPTFGGPNSFRGVLLVAPQSLRRRVVKQQVVDEAEAERIVRILATALPAKA